LQKNLKKPGNFLTNAPGLSGVLTNLQRCPFQETTKGACSSKKVGTSEVWGSGFLRFGMVEDSGEF